MRLRTLFGLWLPLAVSFELMMLEGPAIQAAIGYLPHPPLNLAAWGLTMSLSLIIESPIIMLLATAIALVKDGDSYHALRRFMLTLLVGCTVIAGAISFTPLLDVIAGKLMGQPDAIVQAARPAMQIMLFWTAAIAWRRFYQGVLVRHGHTRKVTQGTFVRLSSAVLTAYLLAHYGSLTGVQTGAVIVMVAVVTEALVTTIFALPIIHRQVIPIHSSEVPLTQRAIFRFHTPLAATTLLTLLALPVTSAALARLDMATISLAAWPVASMVLLVMRGWGFAMQEITVALASEEEAKPTLQRFTWIVGLTTSGITALLVVTPLLELYFRHVLHLPNNLYASARLGVSTSCLLPLLTSLGSWVRGLLVVQGQTKVVYRGMGLNLACHSGLLAIGVVSHLPGMWVAGGAYTLASLGEYFYLTHQAHRHVSVLVAESHLQ